MNGHKIGAYMYKNTYEYTPFHEPSRKLVARPRPQYEPFVCAKPRASLQSRFCSQYTSFFNAREERKTHTNRSYAKSSPWNASPSAVGLPSCRRTTAPRSCCTVNMPCCVLRMSLSRLPGSVGGDWESRSTGFPDVMFRTECAIRWSNAPCVHQRDGDAKPSRVHNVQKSQRSGLLCSYYVENGDNAEEHWHGDEVRIHVEQSVEIGWISTLCLIMKQWLWSLGRGYVVRWIWRSGHTTDVNETNQNRHFHMNTNKHLVQNRLHLLVKCALK